MGKKTIATSTIIIIVLAIAIVAILNQSRGGTIKWHKNIC